MRKSTQGLELSQVISFFHYCVVQGSGSVPMNGAGFGLKKYRKAKRVIKERLRIDGRLVDERRIREFRFRYIVSDKLNLVITF